MAAFTDAPASVHEESAVDWSNGVLAPVTDKEKENAKFTSPDRVTFYSDNAANYDRDMVKYSFRGPHVAAQEMHSALSSSGMVDPYILDVGCGTGKAIEELRKYGSYSKADGLEPAEGMLQIAKDKELYNNAMEKFLFLDCGLEHDKYDAILSSGTFVAGHMKADCMIELCNVAKSGGFIVVTMRHEHLQTVEEYRLNMRPVIDGLVTDGKWRVVKDETFPDWCFGEKGEGIDGHIFVFRKC